MIYILQCSVNKFIRLIFNLNYRTSVTYTMKENEILSIEKLFKFETADFMYRHFIGLPYFRCPKRGQVSSASKIQVG